MTHILALVDSSIYGANVCALAGIFAERMQKDVQLIHVVDKSEVSGKHADFSGSIGLGARSMLLDQLSKNDQQKARQAHENARILLQEAKQNLSEQTINRITTKLINGTVSDVINHIVPEADMIILGKRGEGSDAEKNHLGANFENVVRASNKPVIVASREMRALNKILIASDGGASALKAIHYIADHPLMFEDSKIYLLKVGDNKANVEQQLGREIEILKPTNLDVEGIVETGAPDDVIPQKVKDLDIDMLVMGAYNHSALRRFFVGSTTTNMIVNCLIPIMLFR